jgi:hypothetical protein
VHPLDTATKTGFVLRGRLVHDKGLQAVVKHSGLIGVSTNGCLRNSADGRDPTGPRAGSRCLACR